MDFIELIQKALEYDKKTHIYTQISLVYERNYQKLSKRERMIVELILADLSAMKIAEKLGISHRTVENHRNKIYAKLNVTKTTELIRVATIYETVQNTRVIHNYA